MQNAKNSILSSAPATRESRRVEVSGRGRRSRGATGSSTVHLRSSAVSNSVVLLACVVLTHLIDVFVVLSAPDESGR